jgi:Bacterial Ig domain
MKRNVLAVLVVMVAALFEPLAASAAPPFGFFGGIAGGGNSGNGVLPVTGWALADSGVAAVDIVVDGGIIGRAHYGRTRPRITQQFPNFPDSAAPGFAFQVDTTHFLNGMHTVTARVQSKKGEVTYLNSRDFQFTNTTADLLPFGKTEFPNQGDEMFGNCDLTDPRRLYSVVSGYALDAGVTQQDGGVAYVELLIDRSLFFNSKLDCHFSKVQGGLSDCYGIRRLDIEETFPTLPDSPHSGFRFVLDIGRLLATTDELGQPVVPFYTPGSHTLTIRAGDHFTQVTDIAETEVTFTCRDFTQNDDSLGQITFPDGGLIYGGTINVNGWALDFEGVQQVQILIDGTSVGIATYGLPFPGIASLYPSYPQKANPGFTFALDTTRLSNGDHELEALVIDDQGADTFIGKRTITVDNPIP